MVDTHTWALVSHYEHVSYSIDEKLEESGGPSGFLPGTFRADEDRVISDWLERLMPRSQSLRSMQSMNLHIAHQYDFLGI